MLSPRPTLPDLRSGPQRTCVGCQKARSTQDLLRVVRSDAGSLAVGRTLAGRGAWLCRRSPECLELAIRRGGFARSFRSSVSAISVEALRPLVGTDLES